MKPLTGLRILIFIAMLGLAGCGGFTDIIPAATYVYVGMHNGIAQYTVNADGTLAPLTPASVSFGSATTLGVAPAGNFLYATSGATIFQFSIDSTGHLTALSTPSLSNGVATTGIAVAPDGAHVYVANIDGTITQYAVQGDGSLIGLTPTAVPSGIAGLARITVAPNGQSLYACGTTLGRIAQFTINADGTLTAMTPATLTTVGPATDITVRPDGTAAYATLSNNLVSQFTIDGSGHLNAFTAQTVSSGPDPGGVAIVASHSNQFVYAAISNGGNPGSPVAQFGINADGSLSGLNPINVPAGNAPFAIAITRDSTFLYCTNSNDGTVSQFSIGSGGALTPLSVPTVSPGSNLTFIVTITK